MWSRTEDKTNEDRVTLLFFSDDTRVRQLQEFEEDEESITHHAELFIFSLKYTLLTWVAHYLEGRHREVTLHRAGASASTSVAGQSALMRKPQALELLSDFDFLHWAHAQLGEAHVS